jgi:hypothetical protein
VSSLLLLSRVHFNGVFLILLPMLSKIAVPMAQIVSGCPLYTWCTATVCIHSKLSDCYTIATISLTLSRFFSPKTAGPHNNNNFTIFYFFWSYPLHLRDLVRSIAALFTKHSLLRFSYEIQS